jgi:hypothetical protein
VIRGAPRAAWERSGYFWFFDDELVEVTANGAWYGDNRGQLGDSEPQLWPGGGAAGGPLTRIQNHQGNFATTAVIVGAAE